MFYKIVIEFDYEILILWIRAENILDAYDQIEKYFLL